jgi:hypothetical protein
VSESPRPMLVPLAISLTERAQKEGVVRWRRPPAWLYGVWAGGYLGHFLGPAILVDLLGHGYIVAQNLRPSPAR